MKLIELYISPLTEKHNYESMFTKIIKDKGEQAEKNVVRYIKWAKQMVGLI